MSFNLSGATSMGVDHGPNKTSVKRPTSLVQHPLQSRAYNSLKVVNLREGSHSKQNPGDTNRRDLTPPGERDTSMVVSPSIRFTAPHTGHSSTDNTGVLMRPAADEQVEPSAVDRHGNRNKVRSIINKFNNFQADQSVVSTGSGVVRTEGGGVGKLRPSQLKVKDAQPGQEDRTSVRQRPQVLPGVQSSLDTSSNKGETARSQGPQNVNHNKSIAVVDSPLQGSQVSGDKSICNKGIDQETQRAQNPCDSTKVSSTVVATRVTETQKLSDNKENTDSDVKLLQTSLRSTSKVTESVVVEEELDVPRHENCEDDKSSEMDVVTTNNLQSEGAKLNEISIKPHDHSDQHPVNEEDAVTKSHEGLDKETSGKTLTATTAVGCEPIPIEPVFHTVVASSTVVQASYDAITVVECNNNTIITPDKIASSSSYASSSSSGVLGEEEETDNEYSDQVFFNLDSPADRGTAFSILDGNIGRNDITRYSSIKTQASVERPKSLVPTNVERDRRRDDGVIRNLSSDQSNHTFPHRGAGSVSATSSSSDDADTSCGQKSRRPGARIDQALHTLKSELAAMHQQDLDLLKQLITISETMQRLSRTRNLRTSKSLSLSFGGFQPFPRLQRRASLERQNSAPHMAEKRRQLFSSTRQLCSTDDSMSSIDESEFGSQGELEEPTFSSTLSIFNHAPLSPEARPLSFRFRDVTLSLESLDGGEPSYEEILQRNVRIWKMNSQTHSPVIEEVPFL